MGLRRPQQFTFKEVAPDRADLPDRQWWVWSRRFGQAGGTWVRLGVVMPSEVDGERGWLACPEGEDAFDGVFPNADRAAYFLWKQHTKRLDVMGPSALQSVMATDADKPLVRPPGPSSMPEAPWDKDKPPTEFVRMIREAELTVADATRICGVDNPRTARRWATGRDHTGAPRAMTESARRLLQLVVDEHKRARALEEQGFGAQPRPIKDRLLAEGLQRQEERRRERVAEGKHPDDRHGHGPQRTERQRQKLIEKVQAGGEAARSDALEELLGPGYGGGGIA